MSERFDAIVIGAGANGLVAATRMAQGGLRVLLLEGADAAGGQSRTVEFAPGFRAAPLGADPGWLPDPIARLLGLESLERAAGEMPLSVATGSGAFLSLPRDPARAAEAIRPHSAADAAKWPGFVAELRALAGFLEALYGMPAPDVDTTSLDDLLPLLGLGRKYRALGRRGMIEFLRTLPLSVGELLDDAFECGPLKAAVATGGVEDYPRGPRAGGTGFVLLHHMVGAPAGAVRGRRPWRRGPDAFTDGALAAVTRAGVTMRTGTRVERIVVRDDAVAGVTLAGGEEIAATRVLSTADPATTLTQLVDPLWLDPEFMLAVRNIRHRGCTAYVLYALGALPEIRGLDAGALAGTVSLTPSLTALEKAADATKYGQVSESPHIELTAPTLTWSQLAPDGRQVLVARVQWAPYRLREGGTWDAARTEALAEQVTGAIESVAPGFRSRVLHRAAWSPLDLERQFGLREGAATQGEMGLDQILFMRPVAGWGRHATPVAGLYLGGAGTHPGPGILGGPGWLAAERVLADRKTRRT